MASWGASPAVLLSGARGRQGASVPWMASPDPEQGERAPGVRRGDKRGAAGSEPRGPSPHAGYLGQNGRHSSSLRSKPAGAEGPARAPPPGRSELALSFVGCSGGWQGPGALGRLVVARHQPGNKSGPSQALEAHRPSSPPTAWNATVSSAQGHF